jgi:hypothetical protein
MQHALLRHQLFLQIPSSSYYFPKVRQQGAVIGLVVRGGRSAGAARDRRPVSHSYFTLTSASLTSAASWQASSVPAVPFLPRAFLAAKPPPIQWLPPLILFSLRKPIHMNTPF